MLRSLFAVIPAVIVGLAAAKFIESLGGAAGDSALTGGHAASLIIGWGVGAFIAAMIALFIGRRWAPLGGLAALTILFAATLTTATFKLPILVWLGAAAATGLGGFAAIRLLGGRAAPVTPETKGEAIFDD